MAAYLASLGFDICFSSFFAFEVFHGPALDITVCFFIITLAACFACRWSWISFFLKVYNQTLHVVMQQTANV